MARSVSKHDESVSSAQFRTASSAVGQVVADAARSQIPFREWSDQDVNAEKWELPKVLLLHFHALVLNNLRRFTFLNRNLWYPRIINLVTPKSNTIINCANTFLFHLLYICSVYLRLWTMSVAG